MSKPGDDEVEFPEECYSVRTRRLHFVLPILMFVYSWTKYRMSAFLCPLTDIVSTLTP
jgi:hypothetical protein